MSLAHQKNLLAAMCDSQMPAFEASADRGESAAPVIVLGGGSSQEIFLQDLYARYGAFTLVDIDRDAPCRRWADRFLQASVYDFAACRDAMSPYVGGDSQVITFATGPAGEVCLKLAHGFGLPQRSPCLAAAANDKIALSNHLAKNGMRVPRHAVIGPAGPKAGEIKKIPFPAILKPVRGGGGMDVRVVEDAEEALRLCRRLQRPYLLQEKLTGREELLWMIVRRGRIAALLHGQNLFDPATGWNSPIGLTIERIAIQHGMPARWRDLAGQLIDTFHLHDDLIVAELIADEGGDTIIDVELNGLSAFACARVFEGNLLASLLVDTYLHKDFDGPETTGWVSCMAFFTAADRRDLDRMAENAARAGHCVVEPPRTVSTLSCFGQTVYKGGYLIVTDARDLNEAAATARAILAEAAE